MLSGRATFGENTALFCWPIILVISRFNFEGWIWVLIASIPDLGILSDFKQTIPRLT